jgi:hypothetical protein
MDKRAGPVAKISLERGKISLTEMEISPYNDINTHKQASPVAVGMKVQRYCHKLF